MGDLSTKQRSGDAVSAPTLVEDEHPGNGSPHALPAPALRDPVVTPVGGFLGLVLRHRLALDVAMLVLGAAIAPLAGLTHISVGPTIAGRGTGTGIAWGSFFLVATLLAMRWRRLYDYRLELHPLEDFSKILSATSTAAILLIAVRVLADSVNGAANQAFRLWAGSTLCLMLGRAGLAFMIRTRRREGQLQAPTLIIGSGEVGEQIAHRLASRPELGMHPIGFIDDAAAHGSETAGAGGGNGRRPLLGTTEDLPSIVRENGVRHVIVAFAGIPYRQLIATTRQCRRMGVMVLTVPRLLEDVGGRIDIEYLGGIPLLRSQPSNPRSWQRSVKYVIDRLVAAVLLILLSPLLLTIAVAVKLSSPGPIFYRQRRVSIDGRDFEMLKFRTMVGHEDRDGHWDAHWAGLAPAPGPDAKPVDRRTRVGKVLRKLSLDELPQLFNVLLGDMSLVGPRPERTHYVRAFQERVYRYGDRLRVKPGVTGWAQVHGLRGQTSLDDRVEWDNYYIENWSLLLDLKILLLTIPAMFSRSENV